MRVVALGVILPGIMELAGCSCPSTALGVHDGDQLETTIGVDYVGSLNDLWPPGSLNRCTGLSDLLPGSTLVMRANFTNPSDGCQTDSLLLTLEDGGSASALSQSEVGSNNFDVRLDNGCAGTDYIDFAYFGSTQPSVYNTNSLDGGAVSWYLARRFSPTLDSGCAIQSVCSDLFIANNRRL